MPSYIEDNYIKTFVIIEFKDNQYRVTLKSIKLIDNLHDINFNERIVTDIEQIVLKKDHTVFRANFFNKPSKVLDFTFQKITDFNKMVNYGDRW